MKQLSNVISHIRVTWILCETDELYFYRDEAGTIQCLSDRVEFELRCTHGDEQNFSVTLLEEEGKIRLNFYNNETDSTEDLLLRKTESPDEIILCHESLKQLIYIHLNLG